MESYPEAGTSGVYPSSSVDVTLSRAEADATIEVTDAAGAVVPGTVVTHDGGTRLEWIPTAPMAAGAHTATLTWSCDPVVADFDVAAATPAVADPTSLIDRTWILDIRDGRFVAPNGIGDALKELIEVRLLVGARTADATSLGFVAGVEAEGGGQDLTAGTTLFDQPAAFSGNPRFTVSQPSLDLVVEGDTLTITNLDMSGSYAADGTSIDGFRFSGVLDTRQLKGALQITEDDGVCQLFGSVYSIDCEACPSGDGDFCITLVIADLSLPEAGYAMVDVP